MAMYQCKSCTATSWNEFKDGICDKCWEKKVVLLINNHMNKQQCKCGKELTDNEKTLYRSKCKECCPNNHTDNPGGYCACGGRDVS